MIVRRAALERRNQEHPQRTRVALNAAKFRAGLIVASAAGEIKSNVAQHLLQRSSGGTWPGAQSDLQPIALSRSAGPVLHSALRLRCAGVW